MKLTQKEIQNIIDNTPSDKLAFTLQQSLTVKYILIDVIPNVCMLVAILFVILYYSN